MSGLTSTVPGAVSAFYNLLVAAGAAQSPKVSVFLNDLNQDEPNSYVMLGNTPSGRSIVENWKLEPAALGSGALYETYELCGYATVWAGDFDSLSRFTDTFALFQSVVMNTYINYDGGYGSLGGFGSPILGASAPTSLETMLLADGEWMGQARGEGYAGVVEFCFELKARITIA